MRVKGCYYAPGLPNSIVLVKPDGTVWRANDTPFRVLREDELTRLQVYELPAYQRALCTPDNEIFQFSYFQYGLEKEAAE